MALNEFKYFQERTDERLQSIETKIDALLAFKNSSLGKVAGASLVVSAIVSLAIGLGAMYFGSR